MVTFWLEEELPKPRILALYLNVIELGPGIYGIGEAAEHWFGKLPSELTALDAIFLAGGSTHLAGVRDGIQSYFGKPGRFELEPTEVVGMGASMIPASTGSSSIA